MGLFASRLIADDEEQGLRAWLFENRVEPILFPLQPEDDIAGALRCLGLAQHVGNRDLLRFGDKSCGDPQRFVRREVIDPVEIAARSGFRVLHADAKLVAALDHEETYASGLDEVGRVVRGRPRAAVHRDSYLSGAQIEDIGVGRSVRYY